MERRQAKARRRRQHFSDRIKGVNSSSRDNDNISQTQTKAKEWISYQPEKVTET